MRDGKVQLGEFNLCVAADRPPPAYSQLSSDVALPNLKWIDGHKPVFRVTVAMVSSIHPQVRLSYFWCVGTLYSTTCVHHSSQAACLHVHIHVVFITKSLSIHACM